jgi:hypothetical protein
MLQVPVAPNSGFVCPKRNWSFDTSSLLQPKAAAGPYPPDSSIAADRRKGSPLNFLLLWNLNR